MRYVLPKGFIAVDGISLTVGEVERDSFSVYLIPETLRVTTLGERAVGDSVNLEVEAQTQVLCCVLCPLQTACWVLPYSARRMVLGGVTRPTAGHRGHSGERGGALHGREGASLVQTMCCLSL